MNNNRSTEKECIDNIKLTIMINIYAFNFMRNNFFLNIDKKTEIKKINFQKLNL